MNRPPDFTITSDNDTYLKRWYLIPRNRFFNIYYHEFLHSDEDRALHDHMYINLSVLMDGRYIEHTIKAGGVYAQKLRVAGTLSGMKFRMPWTAHRIALIDNQPCKTIFITGPRMRRWGFHCPKGWRHWKQFVQQTPGGNSRGKGCE